MILAGADIVSQLVLSNHKSDIGKDIGQRSLLSPSAATSTCAAAELSNLNRLASLVDKHVAQRHMLAILGFDVALLFLGWLGDARIHLLPAPEQESSAITKEAEKAYE